MAIKVKTPGDSATKWENRARGASEDYGREAAASGEEWANKTQAAKPNYVSGISAAGIGDRFAGGVRKAGAAKYTRKINEVGKDRYASGISSGKPDYQTGVEPFLSTLAGLILPGRKMRGDPGNLARVDAANKALHAKRLALLGAGGGA